MEFSREEISNACFSSIFGAAVGDAMGVPYEFLPREKTKEVFQPYLLGCDVGVPFESRWGSLIPAGAWSDDTSMMVAALTAICESGGEIDNELIMRYFVNWWTKSWFCSLDFAFGLGGCVARALERFTNGTEPLECGGRKVSDNGNGSLMRILPFALLATYRNMNLEDTVELVCNGSRLTHAHEISLAGCCIFTEFFRNLAMGTDKQEALKNVRNIDFSGFFKKETLEQYDLVLNRPPEEWKEEDIREGGYVADTLKGAMYSIMNSGSYEEAISTAVRLGGDTDTTACVTGALAGVMYGFSSIPAMWLYPLKNYDALENVVSSFAEVI